MSSGEQKPAKNSASDPSRTNEKVSARKVRAEKNALAVQILDDCGSDPGDKVTDLAPRGMEKLAEDLTDDQVCVLNTILEDAFPEPAVEGKTDVYRKLFAAFQRSGLNDQRRFFQIIKDPKFEEIVHVVGRGLVGMRVVKILDKLCDMAESGDQAAIDRVLQVAGFIKSKYDFYSEDANARRPSVNIEEINFGGKTDKELASIVNGLVDVTDKAEIIGGA